MGIWYWNNKQKLQAGRGDWCWDANHKGWLEFKLCPINGNAGKETQECFDKYPLYLAENPRVTKYNLQGGERTVRYRVKLPPNVVCSQCVVQWAWRCGKNKTKEILVPYMSRHFKEYLDLFWHNAMNKLLKDYLKTQG